MRRSSSFCFYPLPANTLLFFRAYFRYILRLSPAIRSERQYRPPLPVLQMSDRVIRKRISDRQRSPDSISPDMDPVTLDRRFRRVEDMVLARDRKKGNNRPVIRPEPAGCRARLEIDHGFLPNDLHMLVP